MERLEGIELEKYIGKRLLVVVPHQDDEILLCAGLIRHALGFAKQVHVVMVTNGDYGCSDYTAGRARLRETVKGLTMLGTAAGQSGEGEASEPERTDPEKTAPESSSPGQLRMPVLDILGYADTGMPAADSFLTHLYQEKDGEKIDPSACSDHTYGLEEKPEYHWEKYKTHAAYCRNSLKQDLKELLAAQKADTIVTTADTDQHGDHSALYRFVCEVLDELRQEKPEYAPKLLVGLVHSAAGDEVWPKRGTTEYDNPEDSVVSGECGGFNEDRKRQEEEKNSAGYSNVQEGMLPEGCGWNARICIPVPEEMRLALGADNLKYRALLQYETALEPGAYDFLMSFIKDEEIFWRMR